MPLPQMGSHPRCRARSSKSQHLPRSAAKATICRHPNSPESAAGYRLASAGRVPASGHHRFARFSSSLSRLCFESSSKADCARYFHSFTAFTGDRRSSRDGENIHTFTAIRSALASLRGWRTALNCSRTVDAYQRDPRPVLIPSRFSFSAMAQKLCFFLPNHSGKTRHQPTKQSH
jgi:hypothetical protein